MRQVRLLAGRYRVLGRLSAGPKGALWLAEEAASSRPVIIAQVSETKAQALKPAVGVTHAHLAQVIRVVRPVVRAELPLAEGESVPEAVAIADLVAGRTLAQALLNTPLPPFQAVRCVAYIASAIDALHRRGSSHGGVSQRSVVLERADEGPSPVLTQLSEPPHITFASPERLNGSGASLQDDVWALHVLLYAALTGRPPYRGNDAGTVQQAMHTAAPVPLASAGVRDERLQSLLDRGLCLSWDERTRSVFDLETELFDWLSKNTPKDSERPKRPALAESKKKADGDEAPRASGTMSAQNPRTATLRYGVETEHLAPQPTSVPARPVDPGAPAIPDLDLPPPRTPPLSQEEPESVPGDVRVPELASALVVAKRVASASSQMRRSSAGLYRVVGDEPLHDEDGVDLEELLGGRKPEQHLNVEPPKPAPPKPVPPKPAPPKPAPPKPAPPKPAPPKPAPPKPAPPKPAPPGREPEPRALEPSPKPIPPRTSAPEISLSDDRPRPSEVDVLASVAEPRAPVPAAQPPEPTIPALDEVPEPVESSVATATPTPTPTAREPWAAFDLEPGPNVQLADLPSHPLKRARTKNGRARVAVLVAGIVIASIVMFFSVFQFVRSMKGTTDSAPAPSASIAAILTPSATVTTFASSPAATVRVPAVPDGSPEEITRCVAAYFPDGSFDGLQDLAFVCEHRDARKGARIMRSRIVLGARGQVSDAMREWSRLEWHELAAYAIFRHACCPNPEPLDLPPPVRSCGAVGTAADNLAQAFVTEDPKFDDRLVQFHRTTDCAHYGNAPGYHYPAGPISGGQVAFAEFLKRNLARRHAR